LSPKFSVPTASRLAVPVEELPFKNELTDVFATADEWTPDTVLERFDPVLRANLQPVGWGPAVDAAGR
jgi:hypothetical protein